MSRAPTESQYRQLLNLGSGAACVRAPATWKPLIRRGWVRSEHGDLSWLRITPDGLRALATAVELYGLPGIRREEDTPA